MTVKDFQLAAASDNFDLKSWEHRYILWWEKEDNALNSDAEVWNWLVKNHLVTWGFEVLRHDETTDNIGNPIPLAYDNMPLKNVEVDMQSDASPYDIYFVTATYSAAEGGKTLSPDNEELGESGIKVSLEIGPENVKIKRSLLTIHAVAAIGQTVTNAQQAIHPNDDGTVEGVAIPDAPQTINYEITQNLLYWTTARIKNITLMRGKVNNTVMTIGGIDYAIGEVRFLGTTGSIGVTATVLENQAPTSSMTLKFGIQENVADVLPIPGFATTPPIDKRGWDYLWISYVKGVKDGKPAMVPQTLYVEQIFETANLNTLIT